MPGRGVDPAIIEEPYDCIPDFRMAYDEDGMRVAKGITSGDLGQYVSFDVAQVAAGGVNA